MREVTPKELQKLNDKSFKNTQKIFRHRLREIAANGNNEATYKVNEYCCGERIKPWLESLGFKVRDKGWGSWYKITWPEEEEVLERLRRECMPILNSSLPAAARRAIDELKIKQEELGTWNFDSHTYDYVCSECGKHSEYTSPYCPNCGKKLKPIEGRNYDKE
jgi:hypothetical protein